MQTTSGPGKGYSRTQILGYLGGAAMIALALIEIFAPDLLSVIEDPSEALTQGLTLLGLGFLRRAVE